MIAFGLSITGRVREDNQDVFYIDRDNRYFIVADGMGGHKGGSIASQTIVNKTVMYLDELYQRIGKDEIPYNEYENELMSLFKNVNQDLVALADSDENLSDMGSTLVAVICIHDSYFVVHAGDSRCYCYSEKKLMLLTDDHSIVYQQYKRGIISKQSMEESDIKNYLLNSFGIRKNFYVDVRERVFRHEDILLLCSDGLTGELTDQEIVDIISRKTSPERMCHQLIEKANNKGSNDNITCIIISNV